MKKILGALALSTCYHIGFAQEQPADYGQIHGNFQADIQSYKADSIIKAPVVPDKMRMNAFTNLIYTKGAFTAGVRYESYMNALQGFDPRFKGSGLPYRFASYENGDLHVTVGNFYEQFGNGLIFRSYEERGLGLDNAMDGIRLKYKVNKGVYVKGVYGKSRAFFAQSPAIMRGADAEIQLDELLFSEDSENDLRISLGGSVLSKYEPDLDPKYVLPENVTAGAGRLNISERKL